MEAGLTHHIWQIQELIAITRTKLRTCAEAAFRIDFRCPGTNNASRHPSQFKAGFGDLPVATAPIPPDNESFSIVFEQEEDGRWLAEVTELPGVMKYGATREDAEVEVTALALRVLADRTVQFRKPPKSIRFL